MAKGQTELARLATSLLASLRKAAKVNSRTPSEVLMANLGSGTLEQLALRETQKFVRAAMKSPPHASLAGASPTLAALSMVSEDAAKLAMRRPTLARLAVLSPEAASIARASTEVAALAVSSPGAAMLAARAIIKASAKKKKRR